MPLYVNTISPSALYQTNQSVSITLYAQGGNFGMAPPAYTSSGYPSNGAWYNAAVPSLIVKTDVAQASWLAPSGDVFVSQTGSILDLSVTGIQNIPVSSPNFNNGYILMYDSGSWHNLPLAGDLSPTGIIGGALNVSVSSLTGGTHSGGTGVVLWENASVTPTSNPTGGSLVYEKSGTLVQRGSGGAITDIAPAGNGTVNSQNGTINRVRAFLRTTSTSTPATIYSYTIPYSASFGAVAMIEVKWTARDTTGTNTSAAVGFGMAGFICSTTGTVSQMQIQSGGTELIYTNFNSTTSGFNKNFNLLTFSNYTGNNFVAAASGSAVSYTLAAGGIVNIQVTPPGGTSPVDWTADIYIQVT